MVCRQGRVQPDLTKLQLEGPAGRRHEAGRDIGAQQQQAEQRADRQNACGRPALAATSHRAASIAPNERTRRVVPLQREIQRRMLRREHRGRGAGARIEHENSAMRGIDRKEQTIVEREFRSRPRASRRES